MALGAFAGIHARQSLGFAYCCDVVVSQYHLLVETDLRKLKGYQVNCYRFDDRIAFGYRDYYDNLSFPISGVSMFHTVGLALLCLFVVLNPSFVNPKSPEEPLGRNASG